MEHSPLQKLKTAQLVKKLPACYYIRRLITVFTRPHTANSIHEDLSVFKLLKKGDRERANRRKKKKKMEYTFVYQCFLNNARIIIYNRS